MTLKGIDAQIMITRTAELTRDAGAQQRRNEVARDFLAVQTQTMAEAEKARVGDKPETQKIDFHKDKEGGSGAEGEGQGAGNGQEEQGQEDEQKPILAYGQTIDIKI